MNVKFSEDVVPLSNLKVNPGKIVNQVQDTLRPVLVTSRGKGVAVVQALSEYENNQEELAFMKAIAQGMADINEDRQLELGDVKAKLGLDQ